MITKESKPCPRGGVTMDPAACLQLIMALLADNAQRRLDVYDRAYLAELLRALATYVEQGGPLPHPITACPWLPQPF